MSSIMVRIEKTWGGEEREYAQDVAVDPNRGIYVVGDTYSFRPGACDAFILKYDSDGKPIWQKTWGGAHAWDVAAGSKGGIYVVGETRAFGTIGYGEVFVLKYNRTGNLIWQKTWRGRGRGGHWLNSSAQGVAVGPNGNIYVAGFAGGYASFGGRSDALILKFDPDAGDLIWQKTWGGVYWDPALDVAVDKNGDIYVVGFTHSFGAHVPTPDVFILKYDSDGNMIWQKTWGGNGEEWGRSVAVHPDGSIYVVGETTSFKASGGLDAFVLRYDRHGQLRWQRTWGSNEMDTALNVTVTPDGNICVVGEITSLRVAGKCDALILNYDSAGRLRWQKVWGGKDFEDALGVAAVDKDILVVGTTTSSIPRILRDARGNSSTPRGVENKLSQPDYRIFGIVNTPNGIERTITGNPSKGNCDAYLIYLR